MVIVPGIANCTETKYVRTFASYVISQGFRVAVLNHLGAKKEAGLSTPRIFTYGNVIRPYSLTSRYRSLKIDSGWSNKHVKTGISVTEDFLVNFFK